MLRILLLLVLVPGVVTLLVVHLLRVPQLLLLLPLLTVPVLPWGYPPYPGAAGGIPRSYPDIPARGEPRSLGMR